MWCGHLEELKIPRKKIIDTEEIRISSIDKQIVERKNCLQVKLQFNETFSMEIWDILKDFYKFQTDKKTLTLTRNIRNSWKGFVMMLLSLSYCKYGERLMYEVIELMEWSRLRAKRPLHLQVDYQYKAFIADDLLLKIELETASMESNLPEWRYMHSKEFQSKDQRLQQQYRDAYKQLCAQEQVKARREILLKRKPDPTFEQIAAPKAWLPYYVRMSDKSEDIISYIEAFSKLLNIDIKKSMIKTEYAEEFPISYVVNPAVFHQNSVWEERNELNDNTQALLQLMYEVVMSK